MSSYLAFSLEKFVMDDELCGMLKHYHQGVTVTPETLAYDVINTVGHEGHYLNQPHTLKRCRSEFWLPDISDRSGMEEWWDGDRLDTSQRSKNRSQLLLAEYQEPAMDKLIVKQIQEYVADLED
jgi:trimethylamine--corrinoid protein Co-methyltransferase